MIEIYNIFNMIKICIIYDNLEFIGLFIRGHLPAFK